MPPKRVGEGKRIVRKCPQGVPYQCSGIVSHQTSPFNVFENVQSQINPFPGRQYECPFVPDENGGYTKQGDDSQFQGDLGICIVQRDHA